MSSSIPYTVFASHILVRRKKVTDKPHLDIDTMVPEVEKVVRECQRVSGKVSVRFYNGMSIKDTLK